MKKRGQCVDRCAIQFDTLRLDSSVVEHLAHTVSQSGHYLAVPLQHYGTPSLHTTFKGFQFIHTNGCASYYLPSVGCMDNSLQHSKVLLSRMMQGSPTFAQPITIHPMIWPSSLFFTEDQQLHFVNHSALDVMTPLTAPTLHMSRFH